MSLHLFFSKRPSQAVGIIRSSNELGKSVRVVVGIDPVSEEVPFQSTEKHPGNSLNRDKPVKNSQEFHEKEPGILPYIDYLKVHNIR